MQDHVLGGDARRELAGHGNPPDFQRVHGERLACQDIPHLTGTDPERNTTKRAMSRGVAVATANRHARLGQSQFRADHVNDPLGARRRRKVLDAMLTGRIAQYLDHLLGHIVGQWPRLVVGWDDVIHGRKGARRIGHLQLLVRQHSKRLRTRDLVNQMECDKELILSVVELTDHMIVPDLLV